MADAVVGFGLGLTGTPKDYTAIVAARERQKGMEEAKKMAEEQKQYQDYMKATVVKDHMNYKTTEIPIELGKNIEEFRKAKDRGDYNGMMLAQQRMVDYANTSQNEYNEWVNLKKNIQSGKQIIDADIDAIDKAKNSQEVANLNPAAAQYDPNARRINWMAVDKVDFPKLYMDIVDKTPQIGGTQKIKFSGPGGYVTELGALDTDPVRYQARLNAAWNIDPNLQQNAVIQYKNSKGWLGKTADQISSMTGQTVTNEDILNESKKMYIDSGMNFLETQYRSLKNEPKGMKIGITLGGEGKEPKFGAPSVGGSSFGRIKYKPDGTIDRSFSYELSGIKQMSFDIIKSLTTTADIRNRNTGVKYEPNAVSEAEWGAFEVVPIYNKNIGDKFEGMIATDEEARNLDNKNNIDWKIVAVGKAKAAQFDPDANGGKGGFVLDEKDNYVMQDASVYAPASKVETLLRKRLSGKQEIADFENYWREMQQEAADKTAQQRALGGGKTTPSVGGVSKGKVDVSNIFKTK